MKNKIIQISIATLFTLVGCGGGGSSDDKGSSASSTQVTGQFIDTYVKGLKYECSSSLDGVTNDKGEYTCKIGDRVTFYLGEYRLGSTDASSGVVTPSGLYPNQHEAALNVAQLLQTLDDNSSDNIITISDTFSLLDDVNATPLSDDFENIVENSLGETLVDEAVAQAHLDANELRGLLSGQTFYWVEVGDDYLDRVTFNANLTSLTWEELLGSDAEETGTQSIRVDENNIHILDGEDRGALPLSEITDDYISFSRNTSSGEERAYFDEVKAKAYLELQSPYRTVIEKTISSPSDWDDVVEIYIDRANDTSFSGIDIVSIKMAHDTNNLYVRVKRNGLTFPTNEYFYNYWFYFSAGEDTFSLENFHDNALQSPQHFYRVYNGRGYDVGVDSVHEISGSANTTSVYLDMTVPKSLHVLNTNKKYTVSLFTHGFGQGEDMAGENEDDSSFGIKF